MNQPINQPSTQHNKLHGSVSSYIIGFGLSLLLTCEAYLLVTMGWLKGGALIFVIVALAFVQLFVQLLFFLHIGREAKPRWNITALLFAILVVTILVLGSLWIMKNLNYNMMTPQQMDSHMRHENEKGF